MMSINVSQSSFPVLQANTMNRHLTTNSTFQIPAGSFPFFTIITIAIWILLYDRIIIPIASKLLQKPIHLNVKSRMGMGLIVSTLAMAVSAIVEHLRRRTAIEKGLINDPAKVVNMSAMWLIPQYCLHGLAEALNAIAQNEFFFSELSKSMSSVAGSLFLVGMGVGNLLASVVVSVVEKVTKGHVEEGWIATNINKGHYDYYYCVLVVLSFVNLFYFVGCSWAYGRCADGRVKEGADENLERDS